MISHLTPPLTRGAPAIAPPAVATEGVDSRYAEFKRRKFFSSLDGLRAISILAVIWHHAASASFPSWVPWVHLGNRGVNLFFVISAFLISTLLLRAKERRVLNVPRFWARRALRILPLYYAMLGVYAVLVYRFEHDPVARAGFFEHLRYFSTFTSNWFVELDSPRVIFYFAWSLAAEEQFYLCWPWIERTLPRFWPAIVALAGLVMTQTAGMAYQIGGRQSLGLKVVSSVPAAILLGVVLAHVLNAPRGYRWIERWAGRRGSAVVASGIVLLALGVVPYVGFFDELLVALALTLLVATCVVREDNDLARFLAWRPVAWVGIISYGIYLMHVLCLSAARTLLARMQFESAIGLFVVTTILSVGVASGSYLTYERYFLRLKERWFGDRRARSDEPPALLAPATAPITGNISPSE